MFTKFLNKIGVWFLLCALLIVASTIKTIARVDYSSGRRTCSLVEKSLLRELGLSEDVNDGEIVQLLDVSDKRTLATALVRYRKISLATPKLLEIVNDVNDGDAIIMDKIAAAEALCDFGNREWMQPIKALSEDPNGMIVRTSYKFRVAGLLARAGDYSQFKVVANGVSDSKDYIRSTAIHQLGNFGHKTDPVTDSAAELLTSAAKSEPVPFLRERAIESLEKIAKAKPEVTAKVIEALQANKDSSDKDLRIMCRAKLKMYGKELKAD